MHRILIVELPPFFPLKLIRRTKLLTPNISVFIKSFIFSSAPYSLSYPSQEKEEKNIAVPWKKPGDEKNG